MQAAVIVDTGPIVALLDAGETHHRWAHQHFESLAPQPLTSESVLSEACFQRQLRSRLTFWVTLG